MRKNIARFLKLCLDNWGTIAQAFTLMGAFGIGALAAKATALLSVYAPLSWVACGFLAALLTALAFAAYARARLWITDRGIRESFYKSAERVNPMDDLFRKQRIAVADLVSPFDSKIENKTFIECEIIGPANILFNEESPGEVQLAGSYFGLSETMMIRDEAQLYNAVVVENCHFTRCKFWKCTLIFREQAYRVANQRIEHMNWVTVTPDHPAATPDDLWKFFDQDDEANPQSEALTPLPRPGTEEETPR